jgi:hypothetical protein
MAASESEFSASSSNSSSFWALSPSSPSFSLLAGESGALNEAAPVDVAGGTCVCVGTRHQRQCRNQLAVRPDHRCRHGLGIRTRISGFEIDDVSKENFSFV